jgi:hypothetical protein
VLRARRVQDAAIHVQGTDGSRLRAQNRERARLRSLIQIKRVGPRAPEQRPCGRIVTIGKRRQPASPRKHDGNPRFCVTGQMLILGWFAFRLCPRGHSLSNPRMLG